MFEYLNYISVPLFVLLTRGEREPFAPHFF